VDHAAIHLGNVLVVLMARSRLPLGLELGALQERSWKGDPRYVKWQKFRMVLKEKCCRE